MMEAVYATKYGGNRPGLKIFFMSNKIVLSDIKG